MKSSMEDLINKMGLFWQYPVITEKEFYNQNKENSDYFGLPWATIIDKGVNIHLSNLLNDIGNISDQKYTCCQHIHFRKLIPLFKKLNINKLYTPHKIKGEDNIEGIDIIPCPLYAVNIEDEERNQSFKGINYITNYRKYLYSFQGAYQNNYLTDIRKKIFKMSGNPYSHIVSIGGWHFNNIVYSDKQNDKGNINGDIKYSEQVESYNNILLNSRFSLCPSGSGPNTIRFWESLAIGSIPVLLSDTLELPHHDLWEKSIIKIKESDVSNVVKYITMSEEDENDMRNNCIELYKHFRKNYKNDR